MSRKLYDTFYEGHYGGTTTMKSRADELLASPIREMQALGKILKEEEARKNNLYIPLAKIIQERYPEVIIGGSAGLYLNGIKLERHKKTRASDLDLIIPYYIKFESDREMIINEQGTSGRDFDFIMICNGVNVDIRIDPKQKYTYIEMDDFRFKVGCPESALEAKIRYIMQGNQKHKDDLYEIIGIKTIMPEKEVVDTWGGS